ncbi:MAG: hypothetical protein AAF939_05925 [Planctomycetota bacterium]
MSNFFLIDQSLKQSGGHHFDYTRCVAKAATDNGFLTTIGTHHKYRTLNHSLGFENIANIRNVFRNTVYHRESFLCGLQQITRSRSGEILKENDGKPIWSAILDGLKASIFSSRRKKRIEDFAYDCQTFFSSSIKLKGDHVLLTTVSEIELLGLAKYLAANPNTLECHWHLQFHYNLFNGRTPLYDKQKQVLDKIRSCFASAIAEVPRHHIHFYTTSDTLAKQYNRLDLVDFEELPYPIHPDFSINHPSLKVFDDTEQSVQAVKLGPNNIQGVGDIPAGEFEFELSPHGSENRPESVFKSDAELLPLSFSQDSLPPETSVRVEPLVITCPGSVRREKGQGEYLQPLVNGIWDSHLAPGHAKIVVQRSKTKWPLKNRKLLIQRPVSSCPADCGTDSPIEYFAHPLDHPDYVDLIQSTDVGLLYYDSEVYFSRRAGVLGELLSSGKPVVVSAGSWLADQVQQQAFKYVDRLRDQYRVVRTLSLGDVRWDFDNAPLTGDIVSFDQKSHPFRLELEKMPDESAMIVEFDWRWPTESGTYCKLLTCQLNQSNELVERRTFSLGHRKNIGSVNCLIPLARDAVALRFEFKNQFHDSIANIQNLRFYGIDSNSKNLPTSSVGLIASNQEDLIRCVDEMINKYDHYRESANQFAPEWFRQHDPQKTIEFLLGTGRALRRAA